MIERLFSRSSSCGKQISLSQSHFHFAKIPRNPSPVEGTIIVRHSDRWSTAPRFVDCALVIIFTLCFGTNDCHGQADRPRVVTVDTGVRFEGEIFAIKNISISTAAFSPIGQNNDRIIVVADGLRRVFLGDSHVLPNFGDSNQANEVAFDVYQKEYNGTEGSGTFVGVGPFDNHGHREFTIGIDSNGTAIRRTYVQGITKITPRYCVLNTLIGNDTAPLKQWPMHISTGTVPKDVLRNVLLTRIEDPKKPDGYFEIAYLFQQMGDFKQASEELRQIESKFPDLKERIRDARDRLGQLKARQILREIDLRKESGQFDLAVQLAEVMTNSKDRLAGAILAEFLDVEDQERITREQVEESRRKVLTLIDNVTNVNAEQATAIKRFRDELETDLNRVNEPRLAAFLRFADSDGIPDQQKLANAISGWLLGSNNARDNLAVVQSMFIVRDLILEYLTEDTSPERRSAILLELAKYEAGAPQFLDQMIQQMKPVDPPAGIDDYVGQEPIEFTIDLPGTLANPTPTQFRCLAHLPPQYNPYRKYPLVLSLPGGEQTLEQNLQIWCGNYNEKLKIREGNAMQNGYIVVAVDWRLPGQFNWGYTGREHRVVTDALYHAMRKFSVDSDRVFLSGHRNGGDGAYDIGISHPEHWAGVMGFSGKFGMYIDKYWDNTSVPLPLYCVNGQKDIPGISSMMFAINKWMSPKYVNPTVVHYIGRGNELFLEDLPLAFQWMRGQKRQWPDRGGFQFSCSALRPGDTYYWFFEMAGIPDDRVVLPELFSGTKKFAKVTIEGDITKPNVFRLGPASMRIDADSTLWLSPQFADLNERIEIKGRGDFKGFVKPSRKVILEDVLRRADREHIFHARIDCESGNWHVKE